MINILFDGRIFEYAQKSNQSRTGVYWVAYNIITELSKRDNINLFLYLPKSDDKILSVSENIHIKSILTDNDDLSEINSYLSPYDGTTEYIKAYPKISCYNILYDIIPLLFPKYFGEGSHNRFTELDENDYGFSISDYTKEDYLKYFPKLRRENIVTMLLSTNFEYKRNKDDEVKNKVCEKYNIPIEKKYLFSLCSLEPRKNLIRAVKTFIEFIKKNNVDDLVYVLGGQAWDGFIEKFEQEVSDYEKYKDRIIRAGYVDDEDLEILYSNAQWFIYTSQYEGFGMPPLEAMACGCPVVTSNNSSLPEVVGDAGIMIDFDSDEQHVEAYEKYYFDEQFRQEMAQKGLERSKLFSWQKAVDIILNKMQEVEAKKAQTPLVTIITATYNLIQGGRKDWFIQNLESVQNQTYKNIEHIVIDGASTDGTIELLEEYQQKYGIKYYSEPDEGIYDALNKGILKANGKYVVCLNSDDFYCDNHAVEWLVSKAEETDADACCASAKSVFPKNCKLAGLWYVDQTDNLIFGEMACHQTFLIKTDVMKELGLYNLKYKISSDTAFMYKMLRNNKKFVKIKPPIIVYRLGGASYNPEKVDADVSQSFYEEYGKINCLYPTDVQQLIRCKYFELPLDTALKLGAKLIRFRREDWIFEYYKRLFMYYLEKRKKTKTSFIKNIFSIKNEYSGNKKYKVIMVLGIKLKIKVKKKA